MNLVGLNHFPFGISFFFSNIFNFASIMSISHVPLFPAFLIFFLLFFCDLWDKKARCCVWGKNLWPKFIRSNLCKEVSYRGLTLISHIGRWRWVKLKSKSKFDRSDKYVRILLFLLSYSVHTTLLVSYYRLPGGGCPNWRERNSILNR